MGRIRNTGGEEKSVHRAGPLKQTNKKHKTGPYRSKRAVDVAARGRVNSSVGSISKRKRNHVSRSARKKQATADRLKRMQDVKDKKKDQGGPRGAPICVALVPLSSCTNLNFALKFIIANCGGFADVVGTEGNATYIKLKNGKNITLVTPSASNDLWCVLDLLKQADVSLFLQPCLDPISPEGATLLKAAKEQGIATPFLGITSPFSKSDEKAFIKANMRFLPIDKIYEISNGGQVANILRMISVTKISIPKQWSLRSSMLIENISSHTTISPNLFTPKAVQELTEENCATLIKVTGVVKHQHLNPYRPVYITGVGTFKILRVDITPMQLLGRDNAMDDNAETPAVPPRFLYDPSLVPEEHVDQEVADDEMMDSDSDIEESDLEDGDESLSQISEDGNIVRREAPRKVPKGTSNYQADWIIDSDGDSEEEAEESVKRVESNDDLEDDEEEDDAEGEMEYEMDWEDEKKQMEMTKAARTEAEFPDWVDTPMDQPAKIRFQRYRGLHSFKKSPWDSNENLPKDYSKIFQFQNFRHVYKVVCGENAETDGVGFIPVGQRVEIILKPFDPSNSLTNIVGECKPTSLVSLLRHETRTSVLNLQLNITEVVKNKDELIFQVGHHRFQAKPILSEVSNGNKHRMLRFAQENQSCMATVIGPIVFPHASVLVFKCVNSTLVPVGSGSLFSADPSRIIVKRVLLSGHPFKVQGRNAVVRFMFFNREDIEWFKPVEIRTRYGRRGHIKEPLGTHGHMKCNFDGQMKSQDTVLMPLYKRVFPKQTYEPFVAPFRIYDNQYEK